MTTTVANTEWEGEFSKTDGTLMSVFRVKFNSDGSAHFKVRRHQVGEWGDWVTIWTWKQQDDFIQFGALGQDPKNSESYRGTIERNRITGRGINWGDSRAFWAERIS